MLDSFFKVIFGNIFQHSPVVVRGHIWCDYDLTLLRLVGEDHASTTVGLHQAERVQGHDVVGHLVVEKLLAKDTSFVQLGGCIALVNIPQKWRAVGIYLIDYEGRNVE